MLARILAVLAVVGQAIFVATCGFAEDWPRWRGPRLDGISRETDFLTRWPKSGPPIAWRANVGVGFSAVAVAQGRLFTLGHQDAKDTVYCLDAASGKPIWKHSYPAELGDLYFEGGTTSTPTVDGDRVYTLSRWGDLFCFEAATGRIVWSKNIQKETSQRTPTWGYSGSPLVHDDLLLLNVGRAGTAVDKATGKLIWTSDVDEAGYSTPYPIRRGDAWLAITSHGKGYSAVDVRTGKEFWDLRWLTRYGVNAADPIVRGDELFLSTGYTKGASLWKLGDGAGGVPSELWRNKNMRNQFNPCVLLDDHLYGVDGDTSEAATLRCIDWKTGEVRWTEAGIGSGGVMAADGKLIVLSDQGELLIAPASPRRFEPTGRAQVVDGKCWTVPVLANGRVYCRGALGELTCVDLRRP